MKQSVFTAALAVLVFSTSVRSDPLSPSDFKILPEPRIGAFIMGNYEFDRAATIAHYNALFEGYTATAVVEEMKRQDRNIVFNNPSQISFLVKNRVLFFDYTIGLNLDFEDGVFKESKVWSHGVK